jgi:uncharacterized protein YdeI (YjbR/CyaY-like superfamily)
VLDSALRIALQSRAESVVPDGAAKRIDSTPERVYDRTMTSDPRIDAYIARQADFARPILQHLRRVVHAAVPEVEEDIKWSMPAFLLNGRPLANMAAFKAHASFGLWQASAVLGDTGSAREAMGQFGRLADVADLPPEEALTAILRRAAEVAREGPKPRPKKPPKPELPTPDDLRDALAATPSAAATFDAFPPGCRREYVEWVTEAKRPETRAKRIAQTIEWVAEGKKRNWKYENC